MRSTSAIVNRALRASVSPVLREAGFTKVDARNGWRWIDRAIWVFNVRAVGNYFSDVTGWPPGSVGVWLGVFYPFMPPPIGLKLDAENRPLPSEVLCHSRSHLERGLGQTDRLAALDRPVERARTDIWWVDRDGGNADEVAVDITSAFEEQALDWFATHSDLPTTLAEIEDGHDCFIKFDMAALLAREIGDQQKFRTYADRATKEAIRIGHQFDPHARYRI